MAINKGNNDEKVILSIGADASQAEAEIQALMKKLDALKELKINANGDELAKINQEIKDIESTISKANQATIKPQVDVKPIEDLNTKINNLDDVELTINPIVEDFKLPEGKEVDVQVKVDDNSLESLQTKLKDLEGIKISADSSVLPIINQEIEQTKSAIQQLNDTSFKPTFDSSGMSSVESEIENIKDSIDNVNNKSIQPKSDNSQLNKTILSLSEVEDMLKHIKDQQATTNDPLKLKSLADEAFNLKLKLEEMENGFADTNQTIGLLEDKLYAMAVAGEQGTAEFGEILAKVSQLKQHVKDVDLAVDALSVDKFGQFIGVADGMVQSFTGVTGALQLMGVEAGTAEQMMAKIMNLQAIAQGLQGVNNLRKQWVAMVATMKTAKVGSDAMEALSISTKVATVSTQGLTIAQKAQTVATTVSTVATKALGMALKAVGIGFVVSLLAMLITHIDDVKKFIFKLIPALEGLGKFFGKITTAVTDFIGVTSDATRALDAFSAKMDKKYAQGEKEIELMRARGATADEIYKKEIENIDALIAKLIVKRKIEGTLSEEKAKELEDLEQKKKVIASSELKRRDDERKERQKEAEDKAKERQDEANQRALDAKKAFDDQVKTLKDYLKQAEQITFNANHNQRQIDLKVNQEKYKEQLDHQTKTAKQKVEYAKKEGKDVNAVIAENEKERNKIVEASRIEENNINKKYDDEYFKFIDSNSQQFLSEFAKGYLDVTVQYNDAMKNATEEQKADLNERMNNNLLYLSKLKQQSEYIKHAERDLNDANFNNKIDKDDDSIEVQKQKLDAQLLADKEYADARLWNLQESKRIENEEIQRLYQEGQERLKELMLDPSVNAEEISNLKAMQNAKLQSIEENNDAVEQATKEHLQKIQTIEKDHAKAKKEIDKTVAKSEIEKQEIVSKAIGQVSQLFGEHTLASKLMNHAVMMMDMMVGAQKALASAPPPFNYIAMAGVIASGMANIKKMNEVPIPEAIGRGSKPTPSMPSMPSISAPVINSTVLKSAENGTDTLNSTMEQTNANMENMVVKAYITNDDLKTNGQKNQFLDSVGKIW